MALILLTDLWFPQDRALLGVSWDGWEAADWNDFNIPSLTCLMVGFCLLL